MKIIFISQATSSYLGHNTIDRNTRLIPENLIREAQQGSHDAYQSIYKCHKRQWYAICMRYQVSEFDAKDCLQEALIKIFTKISQFDDTKGSFEAWTARVVVNENLMFLRKKKSMSEFEPIEHVLAPIIEDDENDLSALGLTKMIQALPKGYRTVFNLYVVDGFSHQEISEILAISVGASKSQLSKARKLLRHQLEVVL